MNIKVEISARSRRVGMLVMSGILLLLTGTGFAQRPVVDGNTLIGLLYLLPIAAFWYVALYESYIALDGQNLRIIKMLVIRKTISINSISSLKHEHYGAAGFIGVNISYEGSDGNLRHYTMPASFFGMRQVQPLLKELLQLNPTISVEPTLGRLIEKVPPPAQTGKRIPRHSIIGLLGFAVSMAFFFFALSRQSFFLGNGVIGILAYPGSLLMGMCFCGYMIGGNLKTVLRFMKYALLFILITVVIDSIGHFLTRGGA